MEKKWSRVPEPVGPFIRLRRNVVAGKEWKKGEEMAKEEEEKTLGQLVKERAAAESARARAEEEDGLLPADGFQQTAALLIGAVAMQKFSPDRGAGEALRSLRELKALASVWLGAWQDMDSEVQKKVDGARVLLASACAWLQDCDWMVARQKKGRRPARRERETGGEPDPPASEPPAERLPGGAIRNTYAD